MSRVRHLVLVNLPWLREKDPRATLGDVSLRARLQRIPGLVVTSVTRAANAKAIDVDELADAVLAAARVPGTVVGIGCYIWNEAIVQRLLPRLRRGGFRGLVVLGGPQITYAGPGVAALYPGASLFVRGYGEDALASLCDRGTDGSLPSGVTAAGQDDFVRFAQVDLGALESPIATGLLSPGSFQRWETQRGCLFRCAFCQWPGGIGGVERFAASRVETEAAWFAATGTGEIAIQDPIFNSRPGWLAPLRSLESSGYRGRVSMQLRPETFGDPDEFLRLQSSLRCKLEFGLQTNQSAEMRFIERTNNLARCDAVLGSLKAAGCYVEISLIFGLPGQTLASFQRSLDYALRHATAVRAFPLLLLRGTPLHSRRAELALVEDDSTIPRVVSSPTFTRADHARMEELAGAYNKEADRVAHSWRSGGMDAQSSPS
ncbi:MAG: B12-binding domain-containing radical SAM protein [Planctomycetes bacterium]|nr:B12-binding domain-containing radical SAM protein [Planctomycetota bacterium]